MTKAIVVGSGLAGLTTAAYLAKGGCDVTVCEQGEAVGGVTRTFSRNGFSWDIGPLGIEGLYPNEPGGIVVAELGCADRIPLAPMDRSVSFPDFRVFRPATYGDPAGARTASRRSFPRRRAPSIASRDSSTPYPISLPSSGAPSSPADWSRLSSRSA